MPRSLPPPGRAGRILAATLVAGGLTAVGAASSATAAPGSDPAAARQQAFTAAANEYGVPSSVLLGVSYLESRGDYNAGRPSTGAGYGPMNLTDAAKFASSTAQDNAVTPEADPRGDDSRPAPAPVTAPAPVAVPDSLRTVDRAAALTGVSVATLESDPVANIRGGAALLAAYQHDIGAPASADPAAWYGAVAKYAGATDVAGATDFADEVYGQIASGASRTTDDGQQVTLPATAVTPDKSWADKLGLPAPKGAGNTECPVGLDCEWIPAPYVQYGPSPYDYGNYDVANRPQSQKIDYIVIHDTEGSYASAINLVQDPYYLGWHYTIRSNDGHVAQHVKTKDVGWHAGNWYVNAKSIGIEHEGYAAQQGAWYTEALYRNSAKLVRYLAIHYGIPLDRAHIIGHDNVPGIAPAYVRGMHWDPGPYWDWAHYFDLLHAPFHTTGGRESGMVTILPDYASNQPTFTGCDPAHPAAVCPAHGSSEVILHQQPSADSPLVVDLGLHPDGSPSTTYISDHGARASTGQQYAVAGIQGDWTAIWYLGQKAWFYNPADHPTAVWATGFVVTPKAGKTTIPVYGRAYPEASAYPPGVTPQSIIPLQYTFAAGQRYSLGGDAAAEYYYAQTFASSIPYDHTVIRGQMKYYEIQFGHRVMYVNAADVDVVPSPVGAPE